MPLVHRFTALICALAYIAPSIAGMEKESYSTRPGLFFAWLSPDEGAVLARFDRPAPLRALVQHCNAGRDVFSLERGTKYRCKFEVFKLPSGEDNWESAGATVLGPSPKSDTRQFGLFSTSPPRTTQWNIRRMVPPERAALEALLQSDNRRFGAMKRQLKLGDASVVSRPGGASFAMVVPGKVVRDEDAFYDAQRHHLFVNREGVYTYGGEVPGKPIKYVDADNSDLPGFVVSEGCDGWCISLWSLTDGLKQLGTFGGH